MGENEVTRLREAASCALAGKARYAEAEALLR